MGGASPDRRQHGLHAHGAEGHQPRPRRILAHLRSGHPDPLYHRGCAEAHRPGPFVFRFRCFCSGASVWFALVLEGTANATRLLSGRPAKLQTACGGFRAFEDVPIPDGLRGLMSVADIAWAGGVTSVRCTFG